MVVTTIRYVFIVQHTEIKEYFVLFIDRNDIELQAYLQLSASELTFKDPRYHGLTTVERAIWCPSRLVLPLVFIWTSLWSGTIMVSWKSYMWRWPFKKDAATKDIVMEDITGYGPILLRYRIGQELILPEKASKKTCHWTKGGRAASGKLSGSNCFSISPASPPYLPSTGVRFSARVFWKWLFPKFWFLDIWHCLHLTMFSHMVRRPLDKESDEGSIWVTQGGKNESGQIVF